MLCTFRSVDSVIYSDGEGGVMGVVVWRIVILDGRVLGFYRLVFSNKVVRFIDIFFVEIIKNVGLSIF